MKAPRMVYFGPWDSAGHHFRDENGWLFPEKYMAGFPFGHCSNRIPVDCCLQPGCYKDERGKWRRDHSKEMEGHALLHHIKGWTALSFWDRSVDTRGGCNSTYFAEGEFTFEQIVEMAKTRFAERWNKMKFDVVLVCPTPGAGGAA